MLNSADNQNTQRSSRTSHDVSRVHRPSHHSSRRKSSIKMQPTQIGNSEELHQIVQQRKWHIIRFHLETFAGKDAICQNANDSTLLLACKYKAPTDIILELADLKPELLHAKDIKMGKTPLHFLCINPTFANVAQIITRLAEQYPEAATCVDSRGMTPLHLACTAPCKSSKYVSIVDVLCIIEPTALIMENQDGETPLEVFLMSQTCKTQKEDRYQRRQGYIIRQGVQLHK